VFFYHCYRYWRISGSIWYKLLARTQAHCCIHLKFSLVSLLSTSF
jgi:hypothetical protein